MPDRGPIYTETLLHQALDPQGWLVEPYNAATAVLFVFVALYWLLKAGRQPFFLYASLVLAVGGIGGTLYHATRTHVVFLILDVVPILILAISAVFWFVDRMAARRSTAVLYTLGSLAFIFAFIRLANTFVSNQIRGPVIGYGMLGLFVIVPMVTFMVRTQFRSGWLVISSLALFAMGMGFRAVDRSGVLPMGTHFLWHTCGALMTHLLLLYLWRARDFSARPSTP